MKRPEAVDYRELPAARSDLLVIHGSVNIGHDPERRKVCRSCGRPHQRITYGEPVETSSDFVAALLLVGFLTLAAFGSAYFVGLYGWPF